MDHHSENKPSINHTTISTAFTAITTMLTEKTGAYQGALCMTVNPTSTVYKNHPSHISMHFLLSTTNL